MGERSRKDVVYKLYFLMTEQYGGKSGNLMDFVNDKYSKFSVTSSHLNSRNFTVKNDYIFCQQVEIVFLNRNWASSSETCKV